MLLRPHRLRRRAKRSQSVFLRNDVQQSIRGSFDALFRFICARIDLGAHGRKQRIAKAGLRSKIAQRDIAAALRNGTQSNAPRKRRTCRCRKVLICRAC